MSAGNLEGGGIDAGDITVRNDFGNVELDRVVFAGLCDVEGSAGNVMLDLLLNEGDVAYAVNADAGSVRINDKKVYGIMLSRGSLAGADLRVSVNAGNVRINFA
jgi:hypothetical protein